MEYTQKEVADMLGISQSYISRLEKRIIDQAAPGDAQANAGVTRTDIAF